MNQSLDKTNQESIIKPIIHIRLCGNFCLSCENQKLDSKEISSQLCSLIAFLAVHKEQTCSAEQIIDALWPDESKNPVSALKNQVYRCRKLLSDRSFPYGKDFISTTKGGYILNDQLPIQIDTQELEHLCLELDCKNLSDETIPLYLHLLDLYSGNFLSNLSYQDWIDPFSRHYHNLFFSHIYKYMDFLLKQKDFLALLKISKKLAFIDRYEEKVHYYMIHALYKCHDSASAVSYYQQVSLMFYNDLGVELSEETRHLYNQISISSKLRHFDITNLLKEFHEGYQNDDNPFYCEFAVAKQIYQYQKRIYERTKLPILIGIITIHIHPQANSNKELRIRAVTQLLESIRLTLRKGDLYSRCSSNQFVILLPNATSNSQTTVLERIRKHFTANFISKYVNLSFETDSFLNNKS